MPFTGSSSPYRAPTSPELPVSLWSTSQGVTAGLEVHASSPANANLFNKESATDENLPLVRFLARQLHARLPQHVELDDLVSAGTLGLLDAVARFDGEKKVQFRSYAQFRIRGAMMDSLRAADWSSRTLRRQGRLVEQARGVLNGQGFEAPSEQQVAELMGIPLATYRHLLSDLKRLELGSLEDEREGAEEQAIDSVPGVPSDNPLFRYLQGELKDALSAAIGDLPEKERLVVKLYYYEDLTMKEIAEVLGVVGSRVSQLHASGIIRLKELFREGADGRAVPAKLRT